MLMASASMCLPLILPFLCLPSPTGNAARLANATQSPPPGMPLVAGCEMSLKPGTLSLLSPGRDVSSRVSAPLPRWEDMQPSTCVFAAASSINIFAHLHMC